MSKITKLLSVLLLLVALTPLALANHDQPIKIKSATIETEYNRVVGEVEVCNSENERVRFVLDVKNLSINTIYKRRLSIAANDCTTVRLRFTRDFASMSNVGDDILIVAKHVRGTQSRDRYTFSEPYVIEVIKGDRDYAGCADQDVNDGVFGACETDFITHLPSGLRVKVVESNSSYVVLKLVHIEWGGTKEIRIYKGRTKKIRSNYDQLKRVELTNVYGENTKQLFLKISTAY